MEAGFDIPGDGEAEAGRDAMGFGTAEGRPVLGGEGEGKEQEGGVEGHGFHCRGFREGGTGRRYILDYFLSIFYRKR